MILKNHSCWLVEFIVASISRLKEIFYILWKAPIILLAIVQLRFFIDQLFPLILFYGSLASDFIICYRGIFMKDQLRIWRSHIIEIHEKGKQTSIWSIYEVVLMIDGIP